PVLTKITPSEVVRGRTTEVTLTGKGLAGAQVVSNLPGLAATVTASAAETLTVRLAVPATAASGPFTLTLKNEAGASAPRTFLVDRFPAVAETEPNDSAGTAQKVTLPATIAGTLGRAGDLDWYRFEAKAGQEVGVQAQPEVSGLDPLLRLVDPDGN